MRDTQPPAVIYLPSSGGNAGSRITPELVARRRFPFRRYSIQDDGSMVVRVRHLSQDARPRPYARPVVRFDTPLSRHGSPLPDLESTSAHPISSSSSNPNPTVELLKTLIPALVEDPTSFEESISSICAAHDIDRSAVSSIMQATRRKPSHPLERTQTLDRSTPSAMASSSTSASSVSPIKQERPFPSGSPGATAWYSSYSLANLDSPPSGLNQNVGDLYVHNNRATALYEMWLCGLEKSWKRVEATEKVYHPIIIDRVLSMRANGTPSWITAASYTTIKGRKEKARATE